MLGTCTKYVMHWMNSLWSPIINSSFSPNGTEKNNSSNCIAKSTIIIFVKSHKLEVWLFSAFLVQLNYSNWSRQGPAWLSQGDYKWFVQLQSLPSKTEVGEPHPHLIIIEMVFWSFGDSCAYWGWPSTQGSTNKTDQTEMTQQDNTYSHTICQQKVFNNEAHMEIDTPIIN